jgi:hypothetical protein
MLIYDHSREIALAALSQEPADLAEGCSYALAPSGLELEDLSSEESAGAESMEKQTAVELGKYAVPSEGRRCFIRTALVVRG